MKVLLEHGANIEAKDHEGSTALMKAAERGHTSIVQVLLEYGANVDAKDHLGFTALERAKLLRRRRTAQMLKNTRRTGPSCRD